jgi:hypothetical protein
MTNMELWIKKMEMHKRQKRIGANLQAANRDSSGTDPDKLREALGMIRDSLHSAADRPDAFWTKQCSGIMEKLQRPALACNRRLAFLCAATAAVVLLCLFFVTEKVTLPAFSMAAGDDQNLLIEVERALNQDCADALAPAVLLGREIEQIQKQTLDVEQK